jgi:peptidyl-tRNA hydrolase, PTH1 family
VSDSIRLIVGLGNPGAEHAQDRHNIGFWFADELARRHGGQFRTESKFHGELARVSIGTADLRLLKPETYMNRSGQSVQAVVRFLKLNSDQVLIVHDDLDLPVGDLRLKSGGGHGGHNGLRDLGQHLGTDFLRLRIGIGHPGQRDLVTGYVLKRPPSSERELLDRAIDRAADAMTELLEKGLQRAMTLLHTKEND